MAVDPTSAPWPAWLDQPLELAAGSGEQVVQTALAWLEALCEQLALPGQVGFAIGLCADEALANITANARRPDGTPAQVWLALGRLAEGVGLQIGDDGQAFDPTAQASPQLAASIDEAVLGGHGVRLMRHYTRAMHYRRMPGGNELLLVFAV